MAHDNCSLYNKTITSFDATKERLDHVLNSNFKFNFLGAKATLDGVMFYTTLEVEDKKEVLVK